MSIRVRVTPDREGDRIAAEEVNIGCVFKGNPGLDFTYGVRVCGGVILISPSGALKVKSMEYIRRNPEMALVEPLPHLDVNFIIGPDLPGV